MKQPVIMWFRQDLRLADHAALAAAAAAGPVIPVFILDDETAGAWAWGAASRWWLHQSLHALSIDVPLVLRRGDAAACLSQIMTHTKASALYFTRDYAPWAAALETRIKELCDQQGVACHRYGGFLLHEPEHIRNGAGTYFKVYTPFSKACLARGGVRAPKPAATIAWAEHQLVSDVLEEWQLCPQKPDWAKPIAASWTPGEAGARQRLTAFLDDGLKGYAEGRDRPDQQHISRLSPHLHWGEISPHQVWHATELAMATGDSSLEQDGIKFLKEVLWREFAYHLLFHVPHFPDKPFRPEFATFPWQPDPQHIKAWQQGRTGYPIVDAGMRELWHTGFMHNRVRMIVASFLIKDLLVPWQEGERWFWETLVDADIGNNAASWQWVAGCGADASPYFRVFNPVLQGEKFDPTGAYVRQWVPELAHVPQAFVHRPWEMAVPPRAYPARIIDHGKARERALSAFKKIQGNIET